MPLDKDFRFSDIPTVQAEGERRARVLFGEDWIETCSLTEYHNGTSITDGSTSILSFSQSILRAWNAGLVHDLPDGSPAAIAYYPNGAISGTTHHCDGDMQDPDGGGPAIIDYFDDGTVKNTIHYKRGVREDPGNGHPAYVAYFASGAIKQYMFCRAGGACDPEDGAPAAVHYRATGEIASGVSSEKGRLTAKQTIEMLRSAQVRRVAGLLAKADPTVIPAGMPLQKISAQSRLRCIFAVLSTTPP